MLEMEFRPTAPSQRQRSRPAPGDFFGYVHTVLRSGYPVRSYALWGRKGSRVMSLCQVNPLSQNH